LKSKTAEELERKSRKDFRKFFFEKVVIGRFVNLSFCQVPFSQVFTGEPFHLRMCHFLKPLACTIKLFTAVIVAVS
jgi:hypothetical protein